MKYVWIVITLTVAGCGGTETVTRPAARLDPMMPEGWSPREPLPFRKKVEITARNKDEVFRWWREACGWSDPVSFYKAGQHLKILDDETLLLWAAHVYMDDHAEPPRESYRHENVTVPYLQEVRHVMYELRIRNLEGPWVLLRK